MIYEVKITRTGLDDNGKEKKFTESYGVSALSLYESISVFEANISTLYPDHTIIAVKQTPYTEVLTYDDDTDKYYRVKYNTLTIDEVTGKDKKTPTALLIQANDFDDARQKFQKESSEWLVDFELVGVTETKILDYFFVK